VGEWHGTNALIGGKQGGRGEFGLEERRVCCVRSRVLTLLIDQDFDTPIALILVAMGLLLARRSVPIFFIPNSPFDAIGKAPSPYSD
jgi:hypothetical protein